MRHTLNQATDSTFELDCAGVFIPQKQSGRLRDTARFISATGERTVVICALTRVGTVRRTVWRVRTDLLSMPNGDVVVTSARCADGIHPLAVMPDALCPVPGTVQAIRTLIESINHPGLQAFISDVFADFLVFEDFWVAQCAPTHHMPGGLAAHTAEVIHAVVAAFRRPAPDGQPWLAQERDIAITAALVHDMGECRDNGRPLQDCFEAQRQCMAMRHLEVIHDAVSTLHNRYRPMAQALLAPLYPMTRFPNTGLRIELIREVLQTAHRTSAQTCASPASLPAQHPTVG